MTLDEVKVGHSCTVLAIKIKDNSVLRIMSLGIIEQTVVKVLTKTKNNIEVSLEGSRLAISKELASCIMVV